MIPAFSLTRGVLIAVTLVASTMIASAQTRQAPPEANVWGGFEHQPSEAEVLEREKADDIGQTQQQRSDRRPGGGRSLRPTDEWHAAGQRSSRWAVSPPDLAVGDRVFYRESSKTSFQIASSRPRLLAERKNVRSDTGGNANDTGVDASWVCGGAGFSGSFANDKGKGSVLDQQAGNVPASTTSISTTRRARRQDTASSPIPVAIRHS